MDVVALAGELPDGQGKRQERQRAEEPPELRRGIARGLETGRRGLERRTKRKSRLNGQQAIAEIERERSQEE